MLEIKNISKTYSHHGKQVEAIKNFSLSLSDREFVALVGPSGCGKSTLLKIIAGLVSATSGEIILEGKKIIEPGKDRGLVFQSFTLFPWLSVKENIAFSLNVQKIDSKKRDEIVEHYLKITGLTEFAEFYPKNLSGGQQQRVAIARTLASDPKMLLMDEPFGALDAQTRSSMQEFLMKLWEAEHKTILFITHDVGEALFLADRVYVLGKQPMEIKKVFAVPSARPRREEVRFGKEFGEMERVIMGELRK